MPLTQLAEKKLTSFLSKDKKASQIVETIIIIGSSLQEEHILRALKNFRELRGKEPYKKINIFRIDSFPNDKIFIKRLIKIYSNLGIDVINIKVSDNYANDFKKFWKSITKNIVKNTFSLDINDVKRTHWQLNDNELHEQLRNYLKDYLKKHPQYIFPLSLQDFLGIIKNLKSHNAYDFILPIYRLEEGQWLKKGSFLDYFLNHMDEISLRYVNFVVGKLNKKDKKKILQILDAINTLLEKEIMKNYGHQIMNNKIMGFLEEFLECIDINEMHQRKNIISFLFHQSISKYGASTSSYIKDFLIKNFKFSEVNYQNNPYVEQAYPQKDHFIYKLFKNNLKSKTNPLPIDLPNTQDDLIKYIEDAKAKKLETLSLYIFLFADYELMIIDSYKELLEKIKASYCQNIENDDSYYRLYVIIYFVLIKSDKKNEYLEFMQNFKEFQISEFPINIEILDNTNLDFPKYSEYDGEPINQKIKEISSFKEINNIFKKYKENYIPINDRKSIITFLNEMASKKQVKDVIACIKTNEEIQTWNYLASSKLDKIIINAENLDEYKNLLQKVKDLEWKHFMVMKVPYNIDYESKFIAEKLMIKYEAKLFQDMLDVIDIKILLKSYSKEINLWLHLELASMIHIFKKHNKHSCDRIYKIVHKTIGWDKAKFKNLLFSKNYVYKNFMELAFVSIFNKNFSPIAINKITALWKQPMNKHLFDSLRIIENIIRMWSSKNLQNKEYYNLMKWIDELGPDDWSAEPGDWSRFLYYDYQWIWIKNFKISMVYNYIVVKCEFPLHENIKPIIIVEAIRKVIAINNNLLKYDHKISNLIGHIDLDESNQDVYSLIEILSVRKIGKATINAGFTCLKIFLNHIDKTYYDSYYYVKKFIRKLDDQHQKEIYAIMKKNQ